VDQHAARNQDLHQAGAAQTEAAAVAAEAAAAAASSSSDPEPSGVSPHTLQARMEPNLHSGQDQVTDPSRMERNTLQICTEPDLQRWVGPERTDLASEMLNANPHPPQRTGVTTAEDKNGPHTLCGVAYTGGNKHRHSVFLAM
jgi:hypothetical protein